MPTRDPGFAQLCAIARRVLDANMPDSEWRERIKRALVAQRLSYPPPHAISDAMDRVERALARDVEPLRIIRQRERKDDE